MTTRRAVFLGVLTLLSSTPNFANGVSDTIDMANSSYIFVLRPETTASEFDVIELTYFSDRLGEKFSNRYAHVIKGFSASIPQHVAETVAQRFPSVLYYEKNGVATVAGKPTDSARGKPGGGSGDSVAQITPYGVVRVGGPMSANGRDVWIVDTGIDLDHPDLYVSSGANFVSDRVGKNNNADDKNGHGTHVAGIVAAKNNSIDSVGVASDATVHPVRVLDDNGVGTVNTIIAGLDYIAANGTPGDVINMSLSAKGHYQSLHDAIVNLADLGFLFSIAAGNSASDANLFEPAHIDHPNVYTISASDSNDLFATFSNYNNPPIDFAAPGIAIDSLKVGGGIVSYSGTSMAAPHVAGILLLGRPQANGYTKNDPDNVSDGIAHY